MDGLIFLFILAVVAIGSTNAIWTAFRNLRCRHIAVHGKQVTGMVMEYKVRMLRFNKNALGGRRAYYPHVEFQVAGETIRLTTLNPAGESSANGNGKIKLLYSPRYPNDAIVCGEPVVSHAWCWLTLFLGGVSLAVSLVLMTVVVSLM